MSPWPKSPKLKRKISELSPLVSQVHTRKVQVQIQIHGLAALFLWSTSCTWHFTSSAASTFMFWWSRRLHISTPGRSFGRQRDKLLVLSLVLPIISTFIKNIQSLSKLSIISVTIKLKRSLNNLWQSIKSSSDVLPITCLYFCLYNKINQPDLW